MFLRIFRNSSIFLCLFFASFDAQAITQYKPKQLSFIKNALDMDASLSLPVEDVVEKIEASKKTIDTRVWRSQKDERVESIHINIPAGKAEQAELAKKLAKKNKSSRLYEYLNWKYKKTNTKVRTDGSKRIAVDYTGYQLMDPNQIIGLLRQPHHNVTVRGSSLKEAPWLVRDFMNQLSPFFTKSQRKKINNRIFSGENLSLEKDLLPPFARNAVRKYLVFKGPNCFHASLAFHGQELTKSQHINVKKEAGYHRAMINYDELWRTINSHFYEVDVERSPLKYGDMVVFFEIPPGSEHLTYFRWIRHAATYLFGPYTFSKGSKSPDTPYSVKTLEEEWNTWQKFTKNLGVKVFRRASKSVKPSPPLDLTDWIY